MERRRRDRSLGSHVFGATGWLFADMLLALAMAFLLANTTGQFLPGLPKTPTPTPCPARSPTPAPLPSLDAQPVEVAFTIDAQGILANTSAVGDAESAITQDAALQGKRAGVVLTYGGGATVTDGQQLANAFDRNVLMDLGKQGIVFYPYQAVAYRAIALEGGNPNYIQFEVFTFTVAAAPTPAPTSKDCA